MYDTSSPHATYLSRPFPFHLCPDGINVAEREKKLSTDSAPAIYFMVCSQCSLELGGVPGRVAERSQALCMPEIRLLVQKHQIEAV
jgi:hypothetical protein